MLAGHLSLRNRLMHARRYPGTLPVSAAILWALLAPQTARAQFFKQQVGTEVEVLVEMPGFGHSEHFAPVAITDGHPDTIVQARITGATADRLLGQAS